MKILKYVLGLSIFFTGLNAIGQRSNQYQINGTFSNAEGEKIYLIKRGYMKLNYEKTIFIDSTVVKDGRFVFSGKLKEPNYYSLMYKENWKPFILDNSNLIFTGTANENFYQSKISGSAEIQWAKELSSTTNSLIELMNQAADSSISADSRNEKLLSKIYSDSNQLISKMIKNEEALFISKHPKAFISLYSLTGNYNELGLKKSNMLFNGLSKKLRNHSLGRELNYNLSEGKNATLINSKAPDFSQRDTSGKKISLESVKGKYILIDFWASWCAPCRAENPNLKTLYEKYKSQGFEIISISLDNDRTAWTEAIVKDKLTWLNLSDLKSWKNSVALKYIVTAVPTNYLLDAKGRIIAKDLKGNFLQDKLTEIFDQ